MRQIERILELNKLIKSQTTGTHKKCAKKLRTKPVYLSKDIEAMRAFGAVIFYDEEKKSYCYPNEGEFVIAYLEGE